VPTYQYACTECGHGFEQFQSFSDDALTECPTCGGRLRKVFNSVGIVFKGSGFYRNDSREAAAKAAKSKDGKSKESVGSAKPDSSSDKASDKKSDKATGSDKKSDGAAAAANSSSSGKGSGSSGSSGSSSGGSSSGSSSTAGSAA
jgi:putative FmdB family regulatory protein